MICNANALLGGVLMLGVIGGMQMASAADPPATQPSPKVVLLGDSIREGYAPIVAELLAGRATVVTPKANGRDTVTLLKNLDEWAIREKPDIVHFNCGIHDTKRLNETNKNLVSPEQYEANLREIVHRLRTETQAKVLFALSTPILDERATEAWKTRSYRLINASITEYNSIALRVMKELDVPIDDLPTALGDAAETARLLDAGGIHFTEQGKRKLAEAVTSFVTSYLPPATSSAVQDKAQTPDSAPDPK